MSSPAMKINGVAIDDTFAEAFGMSATGVIITADSVKWARQAAMLNGSTPEAKETKR